MFEASNFDNETETDSSDPTPPTTIDTSPALTFCYESSTSLRHRGSHKRDKKLPLKNVMRIKTYLLNNV